MNIQLKKREKGRLKVKIFMTLFFLISIMSVANSNPQIDLDRCPEVTSQYIKSEVTPKLEINLLLSQALLISFQGLKAVASDGWLCCSCRCSDLSRLCCMSCKCDQ